MKPTEPLSPLTQRAQRTPLTLGLLREHVPHVLAGRDAKLTLDKGGSTIPLEERRELLKLQHKGERSQEVLIVAALPLIKSITNKEYQRRQAWSSRIPYDDLLQEAMTGFVRGLYAYNVNANQSSPTNYLGQWIMTTIRRKSEAMEHDFTIPYETMMRARKIKATRSRLINELQRDPTDNELLTALNDTETDYSVTSYKYNADMRAKEKANNPKTKTGGKQKFTLAHIEEERNINNRLYSMQGYEAETDEDEHSYEKAAAPLQGNVGLNSIEEKDLSLSRNQLFQEVFKQMKIGTIQKDIILRHFGLSPYFDPQTAKLISEETGLTASYTKNVITSFSSYLASKGGIFHYNIIKMDVEVIEALELSWLIPILGEWPENLNEPNPAPKTLTLDKTSKLHIIL